MPPPRDANFMEVDSDSDVSLPGDQFRAKGKGKAKAGDKRKRDKGKAKAKDTVGFYVERNSLHQPGHWHCSSHIRGKPRTRDLGKRFKKMKRGVYKARWRTGWPVVVDDGEFLRSTKNTIILDAYVSPFNQVAESCCTDSADHHSTSGLTPRPFGFHDGPRHAPDAI